MPAFLNGVVAGLALVIPLGALTILLVSLAAQRGWRVGVAAALGAATADSLYAVVAATVGTAVSPWIEAAGPWLRWLSVAALVGVAILLARPLFTRGGGQASSEPGGEAAGRPMTPWRGFLLLFGLAAANPYTIVYFAALIAGKGTGTLDNWIDPTLWVLGVFLASAAWSVLTALAGTRLGRWVRSERGARWTAAIGAALVLLLAAKIALGL